MAHLLGMSGSLRRESTNKKLMREAARVFGPETFTEADLDLPLFNEDVEAEGIPAPVQTLIDQVWAADAIVIATPEYNKAPSGVLKNALDWLSRPRPAPMVGKPVAVVSATAGPAGGERTKSAAYLMLLPFMVNLVWTPEVHLGQSSEKFDGEGRLVDEQKLKALEKLMEALKAAI